VASRLELMFERAEQRSGDLERNYALLDCWKRRGDDLLYSMIPRSVADRLRTEKNSLSTCQVRACSCVQPFRATTTERAIVVVWDYALCLYREGSNILDIFMFPALAGKLAVYWTSLCSLPLQGR
jgi:hypothetical protein